LHGISELLASSPLLLLFAVIGLGYLLGSIKVAGFQLGVVAVLFVGVFFSAVDSRLALPEHIYILGLVLFVYAVGLQSGPGFFASFRKRGMRISGIATLLLVSGALLAALLWWVLDLPAPTAAGLFCGALTNTPALAATVETVKVLGSDLPVDELVNQASSPVVAYGLAYPFGVLGIILSFFVAKRVLRVDFAKEEAERRRHEAMNAIQSRTFRVTNPGLFGRTLERVLATIPDRGFSVSRIKKGEAVTIVAPDTVLSEGDLLVAVGSERELERAAILFGETCAEHLHEHLGDIHFRRLFVSNKEVVGSTIRDLQLERRFRATITRLQRGDVEFVPSQDTVLEFGDRVRVVTPKEQLPVLAGLLGDSTKGMAETDFLSLSAGIVLGVAVGMIPIPLPNGLTFKLGFAGGPLLVALVLGRLERTGPVTWGLPLNANLVLRQVGLVFFLAGIGTRAGLGFLSTVRAGGLALVAGGALVTTLVAVATIFLGYRVLRLPLAAVMGLLSGMQTQPACLAYANQQTDSDQPNVWYSTVYPTAMVVKIVLAQVLVTTLWR